MDTTLTLSPSFLDIALPTPNKKPRQIFVAYSYRLYPKEDYRKLYLNLEKAFSVKFIFADEKITNLHILQKIVGYIKESRFCIFDISGWNPNVTLEFGLALGMSEKSFIVLNPDVTPINEVPSDLRGVDRVEYSSYTTLEDSIAKLLGQELPLVKTHDTDNFLDDLRDNILKIVNDSDGISVTGIAKILGVSTDIIKVAIKPLLDDKLSSKGTRRGTKYYPI